jgi:hypothetical protein
MGIDTDSIEIVERDDDSIVLVPFPKYIHITIAEPKEAPEFDCS